MCMYYDDVVTVMLEYIVRALWLTYTFTEKSSMTVSSSTLLHQSSYCHSQQRF